MTDKEFGNKTVISSLPSGDIWSMTLREYYAGQAMVGILVSGDKLYELSVAAWAIRQADALIAQLNEWGGK